MLCLVFRQHAQGPHDLDDAPQSDADTKLVETQSLPRLVKNHGHALCRCGHPQRTLHPLAVNHHGRTERHGHAFDPLVGQVCPDLRQVVPMDRPGVQVHPKVGTLDDLAQEQIRNAAGHGTLF